MTKHKIIRKNLNHYQSLLAAVQKLCPTAHIAGGAVRDSLLKRAIRDIDLFLDDDVADDAAKLLQSRFGLTQIGGWRSVYGYANPLIARVGKFDAAYEPVPVSLIALNKPKSMRKNIDRFDFGACMAGWDGDRICITKEYEIDAEKKPSRCAAPTTPRSLRSRSPATKSFRRIVTAAGVWSCPGSLKVWHANTLSRKLGVASATI
jgi:hypothetical protein